MRRRARTTKKSANAKPRAKPTSSLRRRPVPGLGTPPHEHKSHKKRSQAGRERNKKQQEIKAKMRLLGRWQRSPQSKTSSKAKPKSKSKETKLNKSKPRLNTRTQRKAKQQRDTQTALAGRALDGHSYWDQRIREGTLRIRSRVEAPKGREGRTHKTKTPAFRSDSCSRSKNKKLAGLSPRATDADVRRSARSCYNSKS